MKINTLNNLPDLTKPERTIDYAKGLFLGFFILFLIRYQTPGLLLNFSFFLLIIAQFIFYKSPQDKTGFWLTISFFLAYKLLTTYFQAANHLFIALYISLAFLLYHLSGKKEEFLQTNMTWILGLTLLLSGFQKLASPDYRSGAYFLYMLQRGDFLWPLKHLSQSFDEITRANLEMLNNSRGIYPENASFESLIMPFSKARVFAFYLSIISIGLELLAGLLILLKPKALLTHAVVLATVLGVFITRQETGFLTLLSLMGLILSENKYVRLIYTTLGIIFLALILLGAGFL